jgi:hypothetical protein
MLLGRATNHSNDVYRFLNLSTNRVIISRDVLWLKKTYGEWKGLPHSTRLQQPEDDEEFEFINPNTSDKPHGLKAGRESGSEFVEVEPLDDEQVEAEEAEDTSESLRAPDNWTIGSNQLSIVTN